LDAVLYPITADKPENAKQMEEKYAKGRYAVYYDQSKKVADMLHQEVIMHKFGRMPALLVIDKKGIIRYAHYGDSMKDIPKNTEIFEAIKGFQN
jgi:peroxiredoxin Q/BCP